MKLISMWCVSSTRGKPKLGLATPFPRSSLLKLLKEPYYYARPNTSALDAQRGQGGGGGVAAVLPTFVNTFQDGETIGQLSCSPEKAASKSEEVATDECSSIEDQLYTDLSGSFLGRFSRSENVNKLIANTSAVRGEVEVGTTRSHGKPGRVLGHRRRHLICNRGSSQLWKRGRRWSHSVVWWNWGLGMWIRLRCFY